jgi:hypothetical protein
MNASRDFSVMLLLLAATIPSVAESSTLPDYRKDAKKVTLRECDSSTTHVTMYRSATYYVTEAITDSGEAFIMVYSTRGEANVLMKAAGLPDRTEVSREKWYEGIEAVTPNYFRHIRGIPKSDCYLAKAIFSQE